MYTYKIIIHKSVKREPLFSLTDRKKRKVLDVVNDEITFLGDNKKFCRHFQ